MKRLRKFLGDRADKGDDGAEDPCEDKVRILNWYFLEYSPWKLKKTLSQTPVIDVFLSLSVLCCCRYLFPKGTTAAGQIGQPRQALTEMQGEAKV